MVKTHHHAQLKSAEGDDMCLSSSCTVVINMSPARRQSLGSPLRSRWACGFGSEPDEFNNVPPHPDLLQTPSPCTSCGSIKVKAVSYTQRQMQGCTCHKPPVWPGQWWPTSEEKRYVGRHMTKIERSGHQPALIPTQVSARKAAAGNSGELLCEVASLSKAAASTLTSYSGTTVSPELLSNIRQLRGSGDVLQKAACRMFLRHHLARSLGLATTTDESLDALVGDVVKLMESDRELQGAILAAGKSLVQLSREPGVA